MKGPLAQWLCGPRQQKPATPVCVGTKDSELPEGLWVGWLVGRSGGPPWKDGGRAVDHWPIIRMTWDTHTFK